MKNVLAIAVVVLATVLSTAVRPAVGEEDGVLNLDQLLREVREGRARDSAVNRQRIADFKQEQALQQQRLAELTGEEQRLEDLSRQQEVQFEENDRLIGELEERLGERLGSLKELFGVLQQVAGDAQGKFSTSVTQIHNPGRVQDLVAFAARMGQTSDLPTIAEIERLWYELQWEMTQSGKVVRTTMPVLTRLGEEREQEVIRVGSFNLVSEGNYFQYVPETGRVVEFSRQPAARYMKGARLIATATTPVDFSIDPTRGQLLALLVQAPDLYERIAQGGMIGYLIIALGLIAVALAIWRLFSITLVERAVRRQLHKLDEPGNNPLGRILNVYRDGDNWNVEALELKLGEAVLRELPRVNRGLGFLKIVAAVAPLMGLLGTVTGMIITFQSITLFGAGDPKLMASGISQALVTTVLGLTVAIPILLLHQLVQSRARRISELLEQEAVALVALHAGD